MYYIIFDLEFNQDFTSLQEVSKTNEYAYSLIMNKLNQQNVMFEGDKKGSSSFPFEIIQIGAVKLDVNFSTVASFNRFIKPGIYPKISPYITELTGITTEQLLTEEPFFRVYEAFVGFIGGTDSYLCTWGMSDLKELFKNAEFHQLDTKSIPRMFINLQPYVPKYLKLPPKKLLRLQTAVELLNIPTAYKFHNAYYDAYYTAEILKIIYNPKLEAKLYNPSYTSIRPRQQKKIINYDKLIEQFEKMYGRMMTVEEQELIKLAYKMGRTNQFVE